MEQHINYFQPILLADEKVTKMPYSTAIIFVSLATLLLIMAIGVLIFFIYYRKRQKNKAVHDFQVKPRQVRYDIFSFWINYVYIFLIIVGFIGAIVLLPIGITNLV